MGPIGNTGDCDRVLECGVDLADARLSFGVGAAYRRLPNGPVACEFRGFFGGRIEQIGIESGRLVYYAYAVLRNLRLRRFSIYHGLPSRSPYVPIVARRWVLFNWSKREIAREVVTLEN